jgi:hypothetical protein
MNVCIAMKGNEVTFLQEDADEYVAADRVQL